MEVKDTMIQNPWVGPSSYQDPAKSDVKVKFCGRENESYDLMHLIDENFLVTLYGKSGNGKTSLLQAGVFPQLRSEQYLPVMLRLGMIEEGKSFQRYIKEVIELEIAGISGKVETVPVIEEQANKTLADHLWNYFARHHFYNKEGDTLFPVIVFDQFEEVLRSRKNIRQTEILLSQLNYLIDESHALGDCLVDGLPYTYDFNFRFVISIREDELYRLEDSIDNIYQPTLKRCRYRLNALSREDARKIILTPGRDYIYSAEQGEVVSRIIDSATNKEDGNISPFMLSLICSELFKKAAAINTDMPQITVAMIDQLGQNILRDFYLGIVKDLPETDSIFLEDNLVDANRMRNSVNVGMMNKGCASWHNLTEGTNRILQPTNGKVELVHDQLAIAVFEAREKRKEAARLAALEREKEKIRRKNRRRMMLTGLIALVFLVIATIFARQRSEIAQRQDALDSAYAALKEQHEKLMETNSLIKLQSDSLRQAVLAKQKSQDSLQIACYQLTSTKNDLNRKNWQIMENQSRMVANQAMDLIRGGDFYTARLLALEALPKDLSHPDKPYTIEAESALRMGTLQDEGILRGHTDYVYSAFFSPDDKRIVSASKDKTVRIWDAMTGKQIGSPLEGHTKEVSSVSFSPDGKRIVSASKDWTLCIWDATTGKQIGAPLEGHRSCVNSVSFSPDGKRIVSASTDGTLRIWDATTGKQIGSPLKGHTDFVKYVSFSPDGERIVSSSWDETLRIWDAMTGKQIGSPLKGHTDLVGSVSFSPDGKRIVSASGDKTVRIWDATTGKQIGSPMEGHTSFVNFAAFSPDGKRIVSASSDKTLRIWDATTGKQIGAPMEGHTAPVTFASFSSDSKRIVSASKDGTLRIWEATTDLQTSSPSKGHTEEVTCASFSPDGKRIVSASKDQTLRIWDATTGKQIGVPMEGHTGEVMFASFSPDGKRIVSASWDKTLRIWDATTGKQIGSPMEGHTNLVNSAAFSPDSKRIVSASTDGTLRIWDTTTGKQIGTPLEGHTGNVKSASFSPDGKRIVSASRDETLRIWDVTTGKQIGSPLKGHTDVVNSTSFSPDGKCIVSASKDGTLRIWDATSGKQIGSPLKGHTSEVNSTSFSPDGKRIVSASKDGTLRIWDTTTGQQIGSPLEGHTGSVNSTSFSPDGKRIVSCSVDKTVRIWEWKSLQQLIDETRERFKDRQLTPEERRKYYLE